jgi:membrane fusion protein, heavy metal efflux system
LKTYYRIRPIGWVLAILVSANFLMFSCNRSPSNESTHKGEPVDAAKTSHAGESGEMDTEHHAHDEHTAERLVRLSPEDLREFEIGLETASPGKLAASVKLPGEITFNADHLAHVSPRFPGVVKEVRKQLGDHVKKGEVLALIESSESLSPYEVVSLIEGTVVEKHITVGEVVKDDAEIYQVADLGSVWLNLTVYQKDLSSIRVGQPVIVAAGAGIPEVRGTISYISPTVEEHTRTAKARAVLSNSNGTLRPGLFVTADVAVATHDVPVMVPRTALQTIDDQPCVFVRTAEGFQPKSVGVGRSNDIYAEITAGMEAGQQYVAKGAFTLKAQLSKGAFGDGHNH